VGSVPGGKLIKDWSVHAARKGGLFTLLEQSGLILPGSIRYQRPSEEDCSGTNSLDVIRRLLEDQLAGGIHSTGFCLLYEMLVGSVNCDVLSEKLEESAAPIGENLAFPPEEVIKIAQIQARQPRQYGRFYRSASAPALPQEFPYLSNEEGVRMKPRSASLAKLLTGMLLLKITGRNTTRAMGEKNDVSCFPYPSF